MEVSAKARFLRIAPRKARLIVDLVRGLDVEDAVSQLKFLNKKGANFVEKLINSAIANAEHNFSLKKGNLFVKLIKVDEGPVLKRFQPKAFGRAGKIRERMSHVSVVLGERVETKVSEAVVNTEATETKKATKKTVSRKLKSELPEGEKKVRKNTGAGKEIFDVRMKGRRDEKQNIDKKQAGKGKGKNFINKVLNRDLQK